MAVVADPKANHWISMHNRVVHVPWHMPLDPSGKRIITDDPSGDSVKRFYVVLGLEETEAYASSRSVAYCPTGGGGGDLIGIHTHTHQIHHAETLPAWCLL